MIVPSTLRPGGRIGICTPAGPVVEERLRAAIASLRDEGYDVVTSPSAFDKYGLFSAPDDIRARELEDLFSRDDVDAVFSARGGVGTSRLLETLDTEKIARSRKPLVAFSDVTALQWLLFQRHGFVSFTGPLAVEWDGAVTEASRRQALRVLAGDIAFNLLDDFPDTRLEVLRGGAVHGRLMPGNLTMISTLLGTPYMPDLEGVVLFIEDVNEPAYRVDRMLFHLRNAGVLQRIGALLCGDFGVDDDALRADALRTSLLDATRGTDYPVVTGFPYGHGAQRMMLPVGVPVAFDAEAMSLTLSYRTAEMELA